MATSQPTRLKVHVARKEPVADGVACFDLVPGDGVGELPSFDAGSHVDVHIAEGLIRQYSLCNAPSERHRYRIAVLREETSRGGSATMIDSVREGDALTISAPRNAFPLKEEAPVSLLLAGGIGITPLLSMAHRLHELGSPFVLHYCTRDPSRTAFREALRAQPFAPHVHFHFSHGQKVRRLDLSSLLRERPRGAELYLCGPPTFMDAAIATAAPVWPAETIHREDFRTDPHANSGDAGAFNIEIASSGTIVSVAAGESIVAALAAHGVKIPVSCEQGICGTCLTKVLEGVPEHRDAFLTDEEHAANDQMTLCCSRAKSPSLVLDL